MSKALWQPTNQRTSSSLMTDFVKFTGKNFKNYADLHQWSITDMDFWWQCAQYTKIKFHKNPKTIFEPKDSFQNSKFFVGATLNYAENVLLNLAKNPLIAITENSRKSFSDDELRNEVSRCANYLKSQGIVKGDRVAGVVANGAEAIIAMLATASIGAIWSSCSPDFGLTAIFDRLQQVQPKCLFFSSKYQYNGKVFNCSDTLQKLQAQIPSIKTVIVVEQWDEILPKKFSPLTFEPVDFDHPLFIMLSSGTTGVPKCIVHGHGGTLLQHKKELMLHSDLKPNDRMLFYTTCGWMMWNWMVSSFSAGATVVTYDGSPAFSHAHYLWNLCSNEKITHLGTSPKYIGSCPENVDKNFDHLKCIFSTGSPLLPQHFDWVYKNIKEDVHLASISGGTDIISCFMLGNPNLPVHAGEIQCLGLGMAVEVWDENQKPIRNRKGELICTKPFPSKPVGFWNDEGGKKYHQAYFDFYEDHDVWRHGDFIELTGHNGVVVYGRSDATLNPGGVRIGTSEIYRAVEMLREVADSLAVSKKTQDDVVIVLFVKLRKDFSFSEVLAKKLKTHIRQTLSPRHVPQYIFAVSDIPFTRSGKKVELIVSQILNGEPVTNESSLANPEVLKEFREIKKQAHV